jgi:hypothetical protein
VKVNSSPPAPLSWLDKVSLDQSQTRLADKFYGATRELAQRCNVDHFEYRSGPGLTNLDEVGKLWWLQIRHGELGQTLKSIPATLFTGLAGGLGGTPVEGARIKKGKVTQVSAVGHGFNLGVNLLSACSLGLGLAGVAGPLAPVLMALGAVGPLLTLSPLLLQATKQGNAPVHEMAHAMQFLVLGGLVNQGLLTAQDLVAIQNDQSKVGYLWGGKTEEAAHIAERSGDLGPLFETLRTRCRDRVQKRYSDPARAEQVDAIISQHKKWVTQRLEVSPPPAA